MSWVCHESSLPLPGLATFLTTPRRLNRNTSVADQHKSFEHPNFISSPLPCHTFGSSCRKSTLDSLVHLCARLSTLKLLAVLALPPCAAIIKGVAPSWMQSPTISWPVAYWYNYHQLSVASLDILYPSCPSSSCRRSQPPVLHLQKRSRQATKRPLLWRQT